MEYDSKKDTKAHIKLVQKYLSRFTKALVERGKVHDKSELEFPEKEVFDRATPRLNGLTYGTPEYAENLKDMKPALDHHYFRNRHHPEYFLIGPENNTGVISSPLERMSLIDIVEMLMDWKAASIRHADGDILKSIEINQKRFGYSDELKSIMRNTVFTMGLNE